MSDLKPSDGYATIEDEFEARTAKAFRSGANFIFVDSRRQRFQMEAAIYCRDNGWLDEEFIDNPEQQYAQYRWRLTEAGRRHWGISG
jgi:hypothetical protein